MLEIVLFTISIIFSGLILIFKNIINAKRCIFLFLLGLILPFLFILIMLILIKGLKSNVDIKIFYVYFEIIMRITLSLWMIFMLKIFPLLAYTILLFQIGFHEKYNPNTVGKNLKELSSKENIDKAYTIINLCFIPLSILMLYGIWFKTRF